MDDHVALLVTVVLAAENERAARAACQELRWQVDGRIVEAADCSAEEPGCWSVTMRVPSEERATHNMAAPLARAVRQFIRGLGPEFLIPRVACEPPTAWTVLDDPDAVESLVAGAERLLVEAWTGGDPYPAMDGTDPNEPDHDDPDHGGRDHDGPDSGGTDVGGSNPTTRPDPVDRSGRPAETGTKTEKTAPVETDSEKVAPGAQENAPRWPTDDDTSSQLTLRVDVATSRAAGAEWQARALASRISRTATLTGITELDGVISVLVDLGIAPIPAPQAVLTAVSALDRPGWSALRWEGETAITTWTAQPRPRSGITQLELSSGPPPGKFA